MSHSTTRQSVYFDSLITLNADQQDGKSWETAYSTISPDRVPSHSNVYCKTGHYPIVRIESEGVIVRGGYKNLVDDLYESTFTILMCPPGTIVFGFEKIGIRPRAYVDSNTTLDGYKQDGKTWETAYKHIHIAIAAGYQDIYCKTGDYDPIYIVGKSNVRIYGGLLGTETYVDADILKKYKTRSTTAEVHYGSNSDLLDVKERNTPGPMIYGFSCPRVMIHTA